MGNYLKPEERKRLIPVRLTPANATFVDDLKKRVDDNRSEAINVAITYARMATGAGKDVVAVAKKDGAK